jgi:hypothetical protein
VTPWQKKWRPLIEMIAAKHSTRKRVVTVKDVLGPGSERTVTRTRQELYFILRFVHKFSYPRIARLLRRKDHATVIYGIGSYMILHRIPGKERVYRETKARRSRENYRAMLAREAAERQERIEAHAIEGRDIVGQGRSHRDTLGRLSGGLDRAPAQGDTRGGGNPGRSGQGASLVPVADPRARAAVGSP